MKNVFYLLMLVLFSFFTEKAMAQEAIFTATEQEARFPGGEDAMLTFLANNIAYPKVAAENGITGIVYVSFVVNKDGSLEQQKIERDIGGGCGKEVIRALKKMPNWIPAKNNGQAVRSHFTLPVQFMEPEKPSRQEKKAARKAARNASKK